MLQKHELQNRSEIGRRLKSIVDGFVDKHREQLSPKDEITESMISYRAYYNIIREAHKTQSQRLVH